MAKVIKELQFKVVIEEDQNGWFVASVPELEGCYTQGKSIEQARRRIKEAIQLVLETDQAARKEKLKHPMPAPKFFGIENIAVPYAKA